MSLQVIHQGWDDHNVPEQALQSDRQMHRHPGSVKKSGFGRGKIVSLRHLSAATKRKKRKIDETGREKNEPTWWEREESGVGGQLTEVEQEGLRRDDFEWALA